MIIYMYKLATIKYSYIYVIMIVCALNKTIFINSLVIAALLYIYYRHGSAYSRD